MDDRMKLRREKPQSLDQALSSACELEAFRLLETSKRKQANTRTLSTEKENNMAAVTQGAQQDLQEKFDELKKQQEAQFNNLSQQIQQLLKGSNSDKQGSTSQPPRNQQQPLPGHQQQDPVECWYCKQRGHLRRDCGLWKQKQENQKRAPPNAQGSA
jgi:hypothetical protein